MIILSNEVLTQLEAQGFGALLPTEAVFKEVVPVPSAIYEKRDDKTLRMKRSCERWIHTATSSSGTKITGGTEASAGVLIKTSDSVSLT